MLHPLYLALPALLFSLTVHGAAIVQLEANKDGDTPPEPLHYGYNGLDGPASWSSIALTCAGQVQSPINSILTYLLLCEREG
jgi:carbonic anhydrase